VNELVHAGARLQEFLLARQWKFCFIGGIALARWGALRVTDDLDLSLLTGFGREQDFVEPLLARYAARTPNASEFAVRSRVLLLQSDEGFGVDIALAALPVEERIIARASPFPYLPGVELITCSAEDLVVLKAFANRPQDVIDVQSVVARQQGRLDWNLIDDELTPLVELKEEPEILEWVRKLRQQWGP